MVVQLGLAEGSAASARQQRQQRQQQQPPAAAMQCAVVWCSGVKLSAGGWGLSVKKDNTWRC
jgi:hypothetical protein